MRWFQRHHVRHQQESAADGVQAELWNSIYRGYGILCRVGTCRLPRVKTPLEYVCICAVVVQIASSNWQQSEAHRATLDAFKSPRRIAEPHQYCASSVCDCFSKSAEVQKRWNPCGTSLSVGGGSSQSVGELPWNAR